MKRKITLGFSPCPNDTFMFDALINGKIDTGDFLFEPVIADVEQLNRFALAGKCDVTKLSLNAYAFANAYYQILDSGSALGRNCGPLLISKTEIPFTEIDKLKIAIPGKYTTANLLLSIFSPNAKNKTEFVFDEIEEAVLSGKVDAGLIIHENRFTYQQKGLKKIADMGELWEQETGMPIPLGCISVKRNLKENVKQKINSLVRKSVEFAFANPESSKEYVKKYSQEMDDSVIQNHIKLYVNDYSITLGTEGKNAIHFLLQKGNEIGMLPQTKDVFLNQINVTV